MRLLLILLVFIVSGCESNITEAPVGPSASFAIGERVVTNADAVLAKTSTTVPQGSAGTAGSARSQKGVEYTYVDFDSQPDGYVLSNLLDLEDGNPPPPPPAGDLVVGIFGCSSSARDVLDGAKRVGRYDYWQANPVYSGKTIHSYGDPGGFADQYAAGWAAVASGFAANPGTNVLAYGICTRYSPDPRPGARTIDVPYPLPAGQSGSPTKSEMDMIRHIADRVASDYPDVPFYIFALHDYQDGPSDWLCERVGSNGVTAMEAMADSAVSLGISLPMILANGSIFRLGPLDQAAGHIREDGCHATEAGENWLIQKTGGLDAWLDNINQ